MGWQADGIHPLRELYRRGKLNQGDVVVQPAWAVVLWVGNDSFGSNLFFCSLVCVSIVITHDNFVDIRISEEAKHGQIRITLHLAK